jgi:metal-dependent amidase/aminoacylase/carboxypeptidase family protein
MLMARSLGIGQTTMACEPSKVIEANFSSQIAPLLDHFYRNPKFSLIETNTATRFAEQLRAAGFENAKKRAVNRIGSDREVGS